MNKLQICQRVRSEAGIAGVGPVSTIAQTGQMGQLVGWVESAYQDIQDKRADWDFLRATFSNDTNIGDPTYNHTIISTLANWKPDSFRIYKTTLNDEQWLNYRPWTEFRDARLYGPTQSQSGRPLEFSIRPNNSIILWPIPDDTYTITGEYYQYAHTMDTDADEPVFHRFHLAIVFNALMRVAANLESAPMYAYAQKEYNRLINKLENDQHEAIVIGGPLA